MNGFKVMAESLRTASEQGTISKDQADKDIRIYDFLASCSEDDFCRLFDSSAFNDIAKSYLKIAVTELVEEGTLNEDQGQAVRNRFSLLFSEKTAKDVI